MKTSRVCTDMLFSESDDVKFLKNCEKHKKHVLNHCSRARGTVLSLETSLTLTRNMEFPT